ncbi:MAG: ATP-dependent RecD-like DNA helicase [Deltaproteobacteria bacterium]|nr:ATP-dependent RecD-like DNA helicase [Deltaproteobacteria bacterium]
MLRLLYQNEESGWSVLQLNAEPHGKITAVGVLAGIEAGEHLRMLGRWVDDPRFGRQFRFEGYYPVLPSTQDGVARYLASGLVPGVGKTMAGRILDHFGDQALNVLEESPERIREVDGIGPKRAEAIHEAWQQQRAVKEVMIFLHSHGVSPGMAVKIHKAYGHRTMTLLQKDPFRLARDIDGIGFLSADRVARSLGIAPDAPERIEAGLLHLLDSLAGEGHTYCHLGELAARTATVLQVPAAACEAAIDRLGERGGCVIERPDDEHPLVFLHRLHRAETRSAEALTALLRGESQTAPEDTDKQIARFEQKEGIHLAEAQRETVIRSLTEKLLIITGGPGTGKTTVLRAIIHMLEQSQLSIHLCAPTGRAAKRMAQATGRQASTIHRLLRFDPLHMGFVHNADNPLDVDALIVDELSMVDISLFASLLDALPESCRLVLVGDADQLPSVGPGQVLRDLIRSERLPVVALHEIFRQASQSQIVTNAHRMLAGEAPMPTESGEDLSDFHFVERKDPEQAIETIKHIVAERIPKRFDLDPIEQVQVLCPMHKGSLGTERLNRELQARLNPAGRPVKCGGREFRVGDKVMQIRNNYDLEVFNGDLGRVHGVEAKSGELLVRMDGSLVRYKAVQLDELVTAYATTIHKAQGSEYPAVVIALHDQHHIMLQRNLLYTAVTRAERLVVIVGSRQAMRRAIANNRVQKRATRLSQRLQTLIDVPCRPS